MNLSRVVVIVTVTAVIVYAGLNFLLPRGGKSPAAEAATTESAATSEAPAAAESGAESASAEAAGAPASEAPAEESAATTTAEDPALTEDEARRIAANVASEVATRVASEGAAPAPAPEADSAVAEPAAEVPAASADAGADELTDDQKRRIAANVANESSGAADAAVEEETPAPAPKPAAAPKPSQVATAEPATAPAASAPKAAKPAAKAAPSAAPTGKLGNGQDVISAWWKKAPSSEHLNLIYAGEASSEKAVVLLFDSAVDAAAAGSQIKLIDAKGASPSGSWSNGSNPRLIAFKGVPSGRYTVIVSPGLADTSGKSVGTELVGPVYVR